MSQSILLQTALCLPVLDVEALIEGQMIAAMPRNFINPGQQFALYPVNVSINLLSPEQYYRAGFLPTAQKVFINLESEKVVIKAWAKCEGCKMHLPESFEALSQLTVWTKEALQQALGQRPHIFLAYLRVYQLLEPREILGQFQGRQFAPLPNSLIISEANPVLSDRIFALRKQQLEKLQPPQHPELEELQAALAALTITNPATQQLDKEVKVLLGWASEDNTLQKNPDLTWINNIAALGDRSIEQDEGKSNYQAGTDFENIVRKSLEFLGFTVDYFHKGGAGGVDVFCSKPYPLVGECKAGKKIPNPTAVQLLNLGTLRLKSQELFKQSAKLIIGSGEPTTQLKDAATIQGMAIINPKTLEQLVKLQSNYRGSVDLFKLKEYLKPGSADDEVEKYIQLVYKTIKLRSHLVQLVKKHQENTGDNNVEVATLFGAYGYSNPPQSISREEMHEILLELSSPLTGYLGRIKGSDWKSDRFYFLRDLPIV
ncbi:DUF1802 family protein [Scytonema sp. UIC 10036]|uniref:DUF1802 family protein n=1 Tax=Scytonema sp. UIC 10036 TaxID=2304196 RepID=UPI0012DAA96C|nr:DUF1802 family protein [Scytonema sp. UIC 10036]MUG92226.1 DUF1802 family protein [Scytonema sp. UIC 10036]